MTFEKFQDWLNEVSANLARIKSRYGDHKFEKVAAESWQDDDIYFGRLVAVLDGVAHSNQIAVGAVGESDLPIIEIKMGDFQKGFEYILDKHGFSQLPNDQRAAIVYRGFREREKAMAAERATWDEFADRLKDRK